MRPELIQQMLEMWAEHRLGEPEGPEGEHAVHVEHLRIRRDRWEQVDHGYRLLLGAWLANQAIEELEGRTE